jgi:hypothetical protein
MLTGKPFLFYSKGSICPAPAPLFSNTPLTKRDTSGAFDPHIATPQKVVYFSPYV